jgi:hypothetical protein
MMKLCSSTVPQCGIRSIGHAPESIAIAPAFVRSKRVLAGAAAVLAAALASPAWAESLDCAKHIQAAQAAIDKVTDDMVGMEMMPKGQLADVHALLDAAKKFVKGAHHDCDQARADMQRASGLAQADAARGYAEAADILHWQYMKPMSGSTGMHGMHMQSGAASGSSAMIGMQTSASPADSSMPQMHEHSMHAHGMSMGK